MAGALDDWWGTRGGVKVILNFLSHSLQMRLVVALIVTFALVGLIFVMSDAANGFEVLTMALAPSSRSPIPTGMLCLARSVFVR